MGGIRRNSSKKGKKIKQAWRQYETQQSPPQGQRGQESVAKGQEVWKVAKA